MFCEQRYAVVATTICAPQAEHKFNLRLSVLYDCYYKGIKGYAFSLVTSKKGDTKNVAFPFLFVCFPSPDDNEAR